MRIGFCMLCHTLTECCYFPFLQVCTSQLLFKIWDITKSWQVDTEWTSLFTSTASSKRHSVNQHWCSCWQVHYSCLLHTSLSEVSSMYQIVPVAPGEQPLHGEAGGSPLKKKLANEGRPLVLAGMFGCVLVVAAVVAWCYYSASLRKAQLLKTELLDLNKDGFIIHNQAGDVLFSMAFRWVHYTVFSPSPNLIFYPSAEA